ncbi:MAG: hypothetical protein ACI8TQ_003403 [Planctomycetota bacterium]|jgi:hypothetical protein
MACFKVPMTSSWGSKAAFRTRPSRELRRKIKGSIRSLASSYLRFDESPKAPCDAGSPVPQLMLSQLTLFALLQLAGVSESGGAGSADQSAATPVDEAELLGLVRHQTVGDGTRPVLTTLKMMGNGGFLVLLQNSPTAFAEVFFIQVPPALSEEQPSPLLVGFHKFGSSPLDVPTNTSLEQECFDRNWFLLCPLGASQKSFSSIPSQLNTELVIELIVERYKPFIDTKRIYGVGFSMGGGNAVNYAARHLDPSRPMFAAIINHTGPASLRNGYEEKPADQPIMETWFGGTPDQNPFEYARSSVLEILDHTPPSMGGGPGPGPGGGFTPPAILEIVAKDSLLGNLSHVPIYLVRAKLDPMTFINDQLDAQGRYMSLYGYPHIYKKIGGTTQHVWSTLNEKLTLNWLSQFSLELPISARTMADRDDTYFYFDIEQSQTGAFTRFDWRIDSVTNTLLLDKTQNLERLSFDLDSTGFSADGPLRIRMTIADGTEDTVRVFGYDVEPLEVLRDGHAVDTWSFDEQTKALLIHEYDHERPHDWIISPN